MKKRPKANAYGLFFKPLADEGYLRPRLRKALGE